MTTENVAAAPVQTFNLSDEETILTELYEIAGPAVVKVVVSQNGRIDLLDPDPRGDGVGSGIIIDENGTIVTNNHVVAEAADVVVQLDNGRVISATILGVDSATDLAVLRVEAPGEKLTAVPFANSDTLRVGQMAIAIGHPFGLDSSLTVGHISGLGRMTPTDDKYRPVLDGMIQTDAAINPGNSGGPLFNLDGEVVGINTSIFSTSRGSQGIGFAVPSNMARQVISEISEKGYVSRPFLGIVGLALNPQRAEFLELDIDHGLLIQEVALDSPAWGVGLHSGTEVVWVER
ncbi:MAG: trypsin-like serine protease [Chloroflexi bacterium]|nr:trypsin-like serine protease [Chloroflexota bacterium]